MREFGRLAPAAPRLTRRETEVLQLLAQGYSNREIARARFISDYTVRTHVSNTLKKLNLSSRTQAALHFIGR